MGYDTIPLTSLEANLRRTLGDCLTSGRTIVVELPGQGRVAPHPLVGTPTGADVVAEDDDDDLIDRLIASNPTFRAMVERSAASGRQPMDLELEPET